ERGGHHVGLRSERDPRRRLARWRARARGRPPAHPGRGRRAAAGRRGGRGLGAQGRDPVVRHAQPRRPDRDAAQGRARPRDAGGLTVLRFAAIFLAIVVALFAAELTAPVQNALVIPFTEGLAATSAWLLK